MSSSNLDATEYLALLAKQERRSKYKAKPTEVLRLTLPTPPSLNNLFANRRGGRTKSRHYRDWERESVYLNHWPRLSENARNTIRWECAIVAHQLPHTRDVDNLAKAPVDLLCTMTGLRDCYLHRLTIERGDGAVPGIVVTVWLIEEAR